MSAKSAIPHSDVLCDGVTPQFAPSRRFPRCSSWSTLKIRSTTWLSVFLPNSPEVVSTPSHPHNCTFGETHPAEQSYWLIGSLLITLPKGLTRMLVQVGDGLALAEAIRRKPTRILFTIMQLTSSAHHLCPSPKLVPLRPITRISTSILVSVCLQCFLSSKSEPCTCQILTVLGRRHGPPASHGSVLEHGLTNLVGGHAEVCSRGRALGLN